MYEMHCHNSTDKERTKLKTTLRFARYALSTLSSVGFGLTAN